eukprot:1235123-Alexandrium_andersonii.AAC.1
MCIRDRKVVAFPSIPARLWSGPPSDDGRPCARRQPAPWRLSFRSAGRWAVRLGPSGAELGRFLSARKAFGHCLLYTSPSPRD